MKFALLKPFICNLTDLVVVYEKELKRGKIENIVLDSNKLFNDFINNNPDFTNIIVTEPNFGKNLQLNGFTGKILFPAILYKNSFSQQIIRDLKYLFRKEITFEDFEFFISKKQMATQDVKKGGFHERTLEVLRFYLTYFHNVMDDDVKKFLPYFKDYKTKYIDIDSSAIEKRFPLTQKYSTYYLMPKYNNFGLSVLLIHHNEYRDIMSGDLQGSPFGFLLDNNNDKKFSFLFTSYYQKLKKNFIEKIIFFENLDLFYEKKSLKKLINKTMNILDLYYYYQDGKFRNKAISFENEFIKSHKYNNQINDIDLIIQLFNTRNLPVNHQLHPISKHLIMYRNKIVNFYATTNYFIYVYDIKGKVIPRYVNILINLIKNTFSNGYIIQSRSSLLISTFLFKKDFEKQKESFIELIYLFSLEIQIYENLNIIPFSFYQLPSSRYFDVDVNKWNFPIFKEMGSEDLLSYQIKNLELERSRQNDKIFEQRIRNFLETWKKEIAFLKET